MKIKKTLLESLIKVCAKEFLQQINEGKKVKQNKKQSIKEEAPETVGAVAPPIDGQGGTGDSPAIPKPETNDEPPAPSQPETPKSDVNLKGIVLVNPTDKSSLKSIPFSPMADDATIERTLHRIGASIAGAKVKIALSTLRAIKDGLKTKETPTYIYIGKYDPASEELFVLADKSVEAAKEFSVSPEEIQGSSDQFNSDKHINGDFDDFELTKKIAGKNGTTPPDETGSDINENVQLKKLVSRIVKESIK